MFKWFGIVSHVPHTKVAAFADHLREGRLVGSACRACGHRSFPPRADCVACLHGEFDLVEVGGGGTLLSWTRISAAPSGFEALAPYTLGLVELDDGGRALAPLGPSVPEDSLRIGMRLRLAPRLHEDREDIRVDYTLERDRTDRGGRP
jgi:uncharacterized OB-fold protein